MTNLDIRTEANDAFVSAEIVDDSFDTDNILDIVEEPIKKASLTSSVLYFHASKPYAK